MADFVTMLVDMGFDVEKAKIAVANTGNKGVEPAMEWLLAHPDVGNSAAPPPQANANNGANSSEGAAAPSTTEAAPEVPKSYKCEDCGKLFTNMETVEFHAAKTNHSNFSESTEEKKPLTAEEKAEQQQKLLELMKIKRAEREANEKREEIEKEKLRMSSGKELAEARRRLQENEMKELLALRKREKLEEQQARARVKEMIEADKLARKAKFGGGGGGEVEGSPSASVASIKTDKVVDDIPLVKKEYTETKLQLRLPNGKTLVQTFGVQEPLAAVRVYIEVNRDDGMEGTFKLMTNFPRKVFEGDDYDKPLDVLGLVPSAVLMVTKS